MYEQFRIRAEGVSAEVHRFIDPAEALAFMVDFLRQEEVRDAEGRYAVVADSPFLARVDARQLTGLAGVKSPVSRELAAAAVVGISQVDWALADTGTLVQDATAADKRLVSTLPEIHLALVPSSGLRPDMASLLPEIRPKQAGYLAMITGPSRTADIERVLTIGVHGPRRLIILFIDSL